MWNTSWNCSAERIARQNEAVRELAPDVAFFSEWSPVGERTTSGGKTIRNSHHLRSEGLSDIGLVHQVHEHVSGYADRTDGEWARLHWGILAASTSPIRKAPTDNPNFAPGTWLEVHHDHSGLTLVSVRMPAWEGPEVDRRRDLWTWMLEQFDRLRSTPAVVMGDFNTETSYRSQRTARLHGADLMHSLTAELSWSDIAAATGHASPTYASNTGRTARLDYAFASPALADRTLGFAAPTTVGAHHLVGKKASSPLSDHTPVIVDMEHRAASVA